MLWKMRCFALQSYMSHTNHKFPIYATYNVQMQLKSTVNDLIRVRGDNGKDHHN